MPRHIKISLISYENKSLVEPNTWNGEVYCILIFGTIDFLDIDTKNMLILLL